MSFVLRVLEIIAGFFILIHTLLDMSRGGMYTITCLLIAFLFFYWAFRKKSKKDDEVEKKVISTVFIMNVVARILIPVIIISQQNGQLLSVIIALIILFGLPYLIGKYIFSDKSSDKVKKIFFFIVFPMILLVTAGLSLFPFEERGTQWLVVLFFPINIMFWFLQVYLIKFLYKKDKDLWYYWLYNSLSPFWLIWMKITFKNNWGYFLYVVGALLIILFVLKQSPAKDLSSSHEIQLSRT